MDEAIEADRVIVMDDGRVALQGTPKEVFSQVERLRELRLDVPHVTQLAHALQKEGVPLPNGILTIDEFVMALKEALAR